MPTLADHETLMGMGFTAEEAKALLFVLWLKERGAYRLDTQSRHPLPLEAPRE